MGLTDLGSAGSSGRSSVALGVPLTDANAFTSARSVGWARRWASVAAILALAGVSVVLAATSDHVARPTATALYYGYLVAVSLLVAMYWSLRRPGSAFGPLLALYGANVWVVSWQSSDWALAFDLGVLAEAVFLVLTFYVFLAFPSGRLQTRVNRLLVAALVVAAIGYFVPWALLNPVVAGGGALAGCRPACPANVLRIASDVDAAELVRRWSTYLALAVVVAIVGVYWRRVTGASRPQRRALLAVAASSLLFLPIFFVFQFSRLILHASPETLQPMAWAVVGIRVILPLGFLAALLRAELFAGAVRGQLLERLLGGPSPQQWREAVAGTLDDPPARIGVWDADTERYREADGTELAPPAPGSGRSTVEATHDGQRVAALVVDDALAEDPELVRAATSATVLAVEHGILEGQLRASHARIREAGAAERKRIARDLHDSAQQHLVSVRIGLQLSSERMQGPERLELERLGAELDQALEDVRAAANGALPAGLALHGVATALRLLADSAVMPVVVEDSGFGRRSDLVETTVFFCCAEALQNAIKHAGPGTSARVLLSHSNGWLHFSVQDDGAGFDPDAVGRGRGLDNIAERVSAVGGSFALHSAAGRGTRVTGRLPASA